jgi:hypothetical protein
MAKKPVLKKVALETYGQKAVVTAEPVASWYKYLDWRHYTLLGVFLFFIILVIVVSYRGEEVTYELVSVENTKPVVQSVAQGTSGNVASVEGRIAGLVTGGTTLMLVVGGLGFVVAMLVSSRYL